MLIAIGTNHRHRPLSIREKFCFTRKEADEALDRLIRFDSIRAVVIISTCNRVELYADVSEAGGGTAILKKLLPFYDYVYTDRDAARHLFCVSCGLDSQITGETQILEQLEAGLERARRLEAVNGYLENIFKKAGETALKVKSETGLSKGEISIGGIAADFVRSKSGSIKGKNIMIIGTGRVSELISACFKTDGARLVFASNKTYQKAKALAEIVSGEAIPLDALKYKLPSADIVISATSSPHIVLKREDIRMPRSKLLVLDLAVPRDVDDAVRDLEGIELYNLDDLDFFIEENTRARRREIPAALAIIEKEIDKLCLTGNSGSRPEPALLR